MDHSSQTPPVSQEAWIPSLDDIDNAPPGLSYVSQWDFPIGNHPFVEPSELMESLSETGTMRVLDYSKAEWEAERKAKVRQLTVLPDGTLTTR